MGEYRPNVAALMVNEKGRLLVCERLLNPGAWQFPQGGIKVNETPEQAVYRELMEEVGLEQQHVEMLGETTGWLRYRLPKRYLRFGNKPLCIGQKQRWFLLRFIGKEEDVKLDQYEKPEFDDWRWVNYWAPTKEIVFFKRRVYEKALHELAPLLFPEYKKRVEGIVKS